MIMSPWIAHQVYSEEEEEEGEVVGDHPVVVGPVGQPPGGRLEQLVYRRVEERAPHQDAPHDWKIKW